MQSDPDFSQFGHSLFLQVAVIEGEAHEAVLTHAPIPFAAAAGAVHLLGVDPQFDEVAPPRSRSLPLFPVVEAHPAPDPFVEFQHRSIGCQTVARPSRSGLFSKPERDALATFLSGLFSTPERDALATFTNLR